VWYLLESAGIRDLERIAEQLRLNTGQAVFDTLNRYVILPITSKECQIGSSHSNTDLFNIERVA